MIEARLKGSIEPLLAVGDDEQAVQYALPQTRMPYQAAQSFGRQIF